MVHSTIQFFGGQEFGFIVVGIESPYNREKNQSRNKDFLPTATNPETIANYPDAGGADSFLSYVKTEVVPFIDSNYRTLPEKVAVGHSNGGTLISYSMLTDPDFFDAYIAISPNYSYDDGQMVKRFSKLDPKTIKTEKFVFISHSNENIKTSERWTGWAESNQKIVEMLNSDKFKTTIYLETKDFSATENHGTTFPIGAFYGLKSFIDYQFRTGENIIEYYEMLAKSNIITLGPENVNTYAYECFWNGKPHDAITVIDWAIRKFPDENNLYDSQGEFYEELGNLNKAQSSFQNAMDVLAKKKGKMDKDEYNETMKYYTAKFEQVSK